MRPTAPAIATIATARLVAQPTAAHLVATSSTTIATVVLHSATNPEATNIEDLAANATNPVRSIAAKHCPIETTSPPSQTIAKGVETTTGRLANHSPTEIDDANSPSTTVDQVDQPAIVASFGVANC